MGTALTGKSIFYVEEEAYFKQLVKSCLTDFGFIVFDFDNPQVARSKINEVRPLAIISGITFKDASGISFLKEIKSNPAWKNILYIIYTNLDTQSVQNEAVEFGVDGYFLKSKVSPEKIVQELLRIIKD